MMRFLEYVLPKLYPELSIVIEESGRLGEDIYAYYDVSCHTLHIDCDVYDRACENVPRDLFTITHEISHVLLLEDSTIMLARREKFVAFRDPEWQANELAAELLAPHDEIVDMSVSEVASRYIVSRQMAQIQKTKK